MARKDVIRFIVTAIIIAAIIFWLFSSLDASLSLLDYVVYGVAASLYGISYSGFLWGVLAVIEICREIIFRQPSWLAPKQGLYRLALFCWLSHFIALGILWGLGMWNPSLKWFQSYILF